MDFLRLPLGGCFLVGGFVRDWLFERSLSCDLDIASLNFEETAKFLSCKLGKKGVFFEKNGIATFRISSSGVNVDVSPIRGSLSADAKRRDFTVNSIYVPWDKVDRFLAGEVGGVVKDPIWGLYALEKGKVLFCHRLSPYWDPLRLLRFYRTRLKIRGRNGLPSYAKAYRFRIRAVAGERVLEEMLKLLETQGAGRALKQMAKDGILEALFPKVRVLEYVPQNYYHSLWALDHSLKTAEIAETTSRRLFAKHFEKRAFHGRKRRAMFLLVCLLHDIGKVATFSYDANGVTRFPYHSVEGERLFRRETEWLRMSEDAVRYCSKVIRWHMRAFHFLDSWSGDLGEAYGFFSKTRDVAPDLIVLALADSLATCGPAVTLGDLRRRYRNARALERLFTKFMDVEEKPAVSGEDVKRILGLEEGPQIGKILDFAKKLQFEGAGREEILNRITEEFGSSGPPACQGAD